jgi:hypothetical protein
MLDVDAVSIVQDAADRIAQPAIGAQLRRGRIVVEATDPRPDLLDLLIVAPIGQLPAGQHRDRNIVGQAAHGAAIEALVAEKHAVAAILHGHDGERRVDGLDAPA